VIQIELAAESQRAWFARASTTIVAVCLGAATFQMLKPPLIDRIARDTLGTPRLSDLLATAIHGRHPDEMPRIGRRVFRRSDECQYGDASLVGSDTVGWGTLWWRNPGVTPRDPDLNWFVVGPTLAQVVGFRDRVEVVVSPRDLGGEGFIDLVAKASETRLHSMFATRLALRAVGRGDEARTRTYDTVAVLRSARGGYELLALLRTRTFLDSQGSEPARRQMIQPVPEPDGRQALVVVETITDSSGSKNTLTPRPVAKLIVANSSRDAHFEAYDPESDVDCWIAPVHERPWFPAATPNLDEAINLKSLGRLRQSTPTPPAAP